MDNKFKTTLFPFSPINLSQTSSKHFRADQARKRGRVVGGWGTHFIFLFSWVTQKAHKKCVVTEVLNKLEDEQHLRLHGSTFHPFCSGSQRGWGGGGVGAVPAVIR